MKSSLTILAIVAAFYAYSQTSTADKADPQLASLKSIREASSTYNNLTQKAYYQDPEAEGSVSPSGLQPHQVSVYNHYANVSASLRGLQELKEDITQLSLSIKRLNIQIVTLKTVNPTSQYLGKSFVDIVQKNAIDILKPAIGGSRGTRFTKILTLVVKNPIVATLASSNPITSIAHDALSQAINVSNGEINQGAIDAFNEKLQPFIDFYGSINGEVLFMESQLNALKLSLDKKLVRLDRVEDQLERSLGSYSGSTIEDKIKDLYKVNSLSEISESVATEILNSPHVLGLNALALRQQILVEDFIDDPQALDRIMENYVSAMKTILRNAKGNDQLGFSSIAIENAIKAYDDI